MAIPCGACGAKAPRFPRLGSAFQGQGHLGNDGGGTHGAEGHAAAVPGHVDFDLGTAVVAAVQLQARIDLLFCQLQGRFFRKFEPDAVEAAARVARLEFIAVIR